ncbi:MAG: N-acetylmuramoyl-L-alanine amidase [candidate division NC10 bacterium]|nr:N-acetylmuramoyl-L-alanine amidase [candidate division NC10 bacterium]
MRTQEIGGREWLSLRQVAEAVKAQLEWDGRHRRYLFRLPPASLIVTPGHSAILLNGRTYLLSTAPQLSGAEVLVPAELLQLALEEIYKRKRIRWDAEKRLIQVEERDYSLRGLRFHTYSDHTRVVLDLTKPLAFSWKEDPSQIVLRVKEGVLAPHFQRQDLSDGLVRSIELKQRLKGVELSIRLEEKRGPIKVFALKGPDRIVIDVFREGAWQLAQPAPAMEPTIIVIDPGHGGQDSGAVGPRGLKEKDVALDIGLRLKKLLEKRLPVQVLMTRSEDLFTPLQQRTAIANHAKANFFISVHVNAAMRSRTVGFETYYFTKDPSDSSARASVLQENLAVNLEGVGPKEQDNYLKLTVTDLINDVYRDESSALAELLLDELDQILKVENRGVKSGPFYVLAGAAMPAVLVEAAFISNPLEERKLMDETYRQRVAEALFEGIARFKARYEKRMGMTLGGRSG